MPQVPHSFRYNERNVWGVLPQSLADTTNLAPEEECSDSDRPACKTGKYSEASLKDSLTRFSLFVKLKSGVYHRKKRRGFNVVSMIQ
jgi:hypothetical protein